MMASRIIAPLTLVLVAFVVSVPALATETLDLSAPERTLDAYIRSLRSGDLTGVKATLDDPEMIFHLPGPMSISSYRIKKRIVFRAQEVNDWTSKGMIPPARMGDIELHVREVIGGKSQTVSYNLRNTKGEWRPYSWAIWRVDH